MFERIRNLCKEKGITIKKLESSLGFSQGTISHWKRSTPRADKIQLVANALGVTPEYLLTGNENVTLYDPETLIKKGLEAVLNSQDGNRKPAPSEGDGLDAELIQRLIQLTPEEVALVDAFVQGLLAKRAE